MTDTRRRLSRGQKRQIKDHARERHKLQEKFLQLLKHHTVDESLQQLGRDRGWLHRMRARDPIFSERVAILHNLERGLRPGPGYRATVRASAQTPTSAGQTGAQAQKALEELVNLQQKEAFVRIYRETGKRTAAAGELNLSIIEIAAALRADREFSQAVENVRLGALWDAEDNLLAKASVDPVAARFLLKKTEEGKKATPERQDTNGRKGPSWLS